MFDELSWAELLERWQRGLSEPRPPGTDDSDIAAAERRLGVSLPPSYHQFLALADGWPSGPMLFPGLRSAAEIGWFRDLEREWLEIWADIDGNEEAVALMRRALLISHRPDDLVWLLDPEQIDPRTGEWQCVTFANFTPGAGHPRSSLRAAMNQAFLVFTSETRSDPASLQAIDDRIEQVYRRLLGGDVAAFDDLDELRSTPSWRVGAIHVQSASDRGRPDLGLLAGDDERSTADVVADPVFQQEILPYWVFRMANQRYHYELDHPPEPLIELVAPLRAELDGTGLRPDYTRTPALADAVRQAQALIPEDPWRAWQLILDGLAGWEPISSHHLLPLGLLFDVRLQPLLTMPSNTSMGNPLFRFFMDNPQRSRELYQVPRAPRYLADGSWPR